MNLIYASKHRSYSLSTFIGEIVSMKKKTNYPQTRIKKPEPESEVESWIVWAAWADRITFEEIKERTGWTEKDVVHHMRKYLKRSSFKLWRKRVHQKISIKHRKKFHQQRIQERCKYSNQLQIED